MVAPAISPVRALELAYLHSSVDMSLEALLERFPDLQDEELAELIEADGRTRISLGRSIDLRRYLDAIPDLGDRESSLDAAIEMTLRSRSGTSIPTSEAVEALIREHPSFETAIRECSAISHAIGSTRSVRQCFEDRPHLTLPCEFGPRMNASQRRYYLVDRLGKGAWGEVYLAIDRKLSDPQNDALVAIKLLLSAGRPKLARRRLVEEASKARRVDHPNVVRVIDRGSTDEGDDYVVYEYVDGGDLDHWLESRAGPLDPRDAAVLAAGIAAGVQAVHTAALIHLDLKPGNIIMTAEGEPKVSDFGIAIRQASETAPGQTDRGVFVGNLAFVSPEQYRMEESGFSTRSDVYAVGGILYFLLTGELPNGRTVEEITRNLDTERGRRCPPSARRVAPGVDRDLDLICQRAMAPALSDRYASVGSLLEDLQAWLRHEPLRWTRPSTIRAVRLWIRRKPALAAVSLLLVLTLMAGATVAWRLESRVRENAVQAAIAEAKIEGATEANREFASTLSDDRVESDFLPLLLWFEWFLRATDDDGKILWDQRIQISRRMIEAAHARGGDDDLETLAWEFGLGFWLVSEGEHVESERVLAQTLAKARRILRGNDMWIRELELLQACAHVNRFVSQVEGGQTPPAAEMLEVEVALRNGIDPLTEDLLKRPVPLLALRTLARLCQPDLLDDRDRHQAVTARLEAAAR